MHPRGYVHKHGVHPLGQNHAKLVGLILEGLRAQCMPTRYIHNWCDSTPRLDIRFLYLWVWHLVHKQGDNQNIVKCVSDGQQIKHACVLKGIWLVNLKIMSVPHNIVKDFNNILAIQTSLV